MGRYAIRKVYVTGYGFADGTPATAKELADELANMVGGFFGRTLNPEQTAELSSHIIASGIGWANEEFDLGIGEAVE